MYPSHVDSPLWASPFACYQQDDGLFPYVDMISPSVSDKASEDFLDRFQVLADTSFCPVEASVASPDCMERLPILDPDEAFILASLLLDPPVQEESSAGFQTIKEPSISSYVDAMAPLASSNNSTRSLSPIAPSPQMMRIQHPPLAPAPIRMTAGHDEALPAAKRQRIDTTDTQQLKAARGHCCVAPGCVKTSQSRGLCIRHGGGKRCSVEGCSRGAQATGRCKSHGGGVRCKVPGCGKGSQGSGLCRSHGGGKICEFPGCKKGTQRAGKCSTHGGARICVVPGCTKVDRGGGLCGRHKQLKP